MEKIHKLKKILLVNGEFPPLAGGGGVYTFNLAYGLAFLYPKLDIVVLSGTSDNAVVKLEEHLLPNLTILRYRDLHLIDEGQVHIWNIAQILNDVISSYLPDIVHTHHIYESFAGILCKQILKFPLIVSIQKSPVAEFTDWKNDPQWSLIRFLFEKGDYEHVIANSNAYKNMAKFFGSKSQISTIYYGIKKDDFYSDKKIRQKTRKDLKIDQQSFVIFCPSRIDERKGIDILLNAISILRKSNEDLFRKVKIIIAGNSFYSSVDSYRNFIIRLINDLHLNEKVLILGRDAIYSKMNSFYNASDLVVIPSNREGLGLVAIEAMNVKKPILASNTVGLNEVILESKSGYLFKRNDSENLAHKVSEIMLSYKEAFKIGKQGYNYQLDKFSIREMATKHYEVYKDIFLKFK